MVKKITALVLALLLTHASLIALADTSSDIQAQIDKLVPGYNTAEVKAQYVGESANFTASAREVLALLAMDKQSDTDYAYLKDIETPNEDDFGAIALYILAKLMLGENPGNAQTDKLAEKFRGEDGAYGDGTNTNNQAYAILALRAVRAAALTGNYSPAGYDEPKAVQALIDTQFENGGFSYEVYDPEAVYPAEAEVDSTGLIITALSLFDTSEVKASVAKAVKWLKDELDANGVDGQFVSWGAASVSSTAWAVSALFAVGEDLTSEKWSQNGKTLIDGLLAFEPSEAGYYESDWAPGPNIFSQRDAIRALYDLKLGYSFLKKLATVQTSQDTGTDREPENNNTSQANNGNQTGNGSGSNPDTGAPRSLPFAAALALCAAVAAAVAVKKKKSPHTLTVYR
jgi:hypothetical protein